MSDEELWCAVYLAAIPPLISADRFLNIGNAAALKAIATSAAIVASSAIAKRALQFGAQEPT